MQILPHFAAFCCSGCPKKSSWAQQVHRHKDPGASQCHRAHGRLLLVRPLLRPESCAGESGRLYRIRSRLYRSQILQEMLRLKAFANLMHLRSRQRRARGGTGTLAFDFKCPDRGKGKGNFEVPFSRFSELLGLVLGCIEANFCK